MNIYPIWYIYSVLKEYENLPDKLFCNIVATHSPLVSRASWPYTEPTKLQNDTYRRCKKLNDKMLYIR